MFGWLKNMMGGVRKPAPPPTLQGPLSESDLRHALERPCAPLVFAKPANIDPFTTMFGTVRLSHKNEKWPMLGGVPMWPFYQFNLTQAPLVPDALNDLALITLFTLPDVASVPNHIVNTAKPDPAAHWVLRSYRTLDGLTIPNPPDHNSPLKPRLGEWIGVHPDYANHDLAPNIIDTQGADIYAHDWCRPLALTKLGGWPNMPQSAPSWMRGRDRDRWDFALQIEAEPDTAGWSGSGHGVVCIARSRRRPHLWAIDVQVT